jgi:ectoine hydroxylase-related dioxygenase (phytanoyl-CoA dioxygenase family)
VQPPSSFLENILAVRIHLDDTNDESGALRIVPGSHALGRLTAEAIQRVHDEVGEVSVPVSRGGAMLMRPLLLHASYNVRVDRPRPVLGIFEAAQRNEISKRAASASRFLSKVHSMASEVSSTDPSNSRSTAPQPES